MDDEYISGKELYTFMLYLFTKHRVNHIDIDYESIFSTSKFITIRDTIIVNRFKIIKDTMGAIINIDDRETFDIDDYKKWLDSFMNQCIMSLARMNELEIIFMKSFNKGNHLYWKNKNYDQINILKNKFKIESSDSMFDQEKNGWTEKGINEYINALQGNGDNGFIIINENTGYMSFISMKGNDIRMAYNLDRFLFGLAQSKE